MDAAYLRAALPEPFKVLGKKLRPFQLGHEILFQRFGVRYSIESADAPDIGDLFKAVHVCSQDYSPDVTLENFSIPIRVRLVGKIFGAQFIDDSMNLFRAYIAEHSAIPDFYTKGEGSTARVGTPTIQAVKVSLMANLGLSELEALRTPVALAFWNHLSWAENQGSIQIIDDREREIIAAAKANESAVEAMQKRLQEMMNGAKEAAPCST